MRYAYEYSMRHAYNAGVDDGNNGGPALFTLVRFWSRRWMNRALLGVAAGPDAETRNIAHIQVIEAVATAIDRDDEVTVNGVAAQLAMDQSGASRMIRDAVAAGYLARKNSGHDRRRAVVELTAEGKRLHGQALRWQQRCFDDLTAAWSDRDRSLFAGYLRRLADETTTYGAKSQRPQT
jgi:DNA-binding MarR family transcriptional regulator